MPNYYNLNSYFKREGLLEEESDLYLSILLRSYYIYENDYRIIESDLIKKPFDKNIPFNLVITNDSEIKNFSGILRFRGLRKCTLTDIKISDEKLSYNETFNLDKDMVIRETICNDGNTITSYMSKLDYKELEDMKKQAMEDNIKLTL